MRRPELFFFALVLLSAPAAGGGGTFDGDTYSFEHQLGALIDDIFKCFELHMTGMDDNTVVFDGMTEFLDPYTNGTQPFIFEFETSSRAGFLRGPESEIEINSIAGDDLFPEGFMDPESGTPLTDACIEIGIDDTLDSTEPIEVVSAVLDFEGDSFDAFDITSAFSDPWDGRLSIVFPGFAGLDITGVRLRLDTAASGSHIFADGFETGNTASWTDQQP